MEEQKQNKWERLFESFLCTTEFSLIHYEFGKTSENDEDVTGHWSLDDKQGANLGEIEGDVFDTAEQIVDRMSIYINDYFYRDLEDEAVAYGLESFDMDEFAKKYGEAVYWRGADFWLGIREELGEENEFVKDHVYDFDIIEMLARHTDEIDLYNIYYEEM